VLARLGSG